MFLAACGGDASGDDEPDPDAGGDVLADAGPCPDVDLDPPWLADTLSDAVARLSGELPITGTTTLVDRATVTRRGLVRDWLLAQLGALDVPGQLHEYGTGANVIARLPGTDASAGWILLGAHFDSANSSPGANDNATGVAAVLAATRMLRTTCRRAGLIVAFFDQEEIGLVGSTNLAGDLFQAGEDLRAVHTVDQVGWDQDGDRVFEIELPTAALFAEYQAAATSLGFGLSQTATSGTDHSAFRDRGFAAAGVTEEYVGGDTTPHYHELTDTFDTVDLAYNADGTRLVAAVLSVQLE